MNLAEVLKNQVQIFAQTFTTLTTLSPDMLDCSRIEHSAAGAVTINLPTATPDMDKFMCIISNAGAGDLSIGYPLGFGGSGNNGITLARGEFALFFCDGLTWYVCSHTAPGTL